VLSQFMGTHDIFLTWIRSDKRYRFGMWWL